MRYKCAYPPIMTGRMGLGDMGKLILDAKDKAARVTALPQTVFRILNQGLHRCQYQTSSVHLLLLDESLP